MAMLKPPPPERKEREPMNQNSFYLAMVAGMVAIIVALSFNAYATWTAVECTTVYFIEDSLPAGSIAGGAVGTVRHTCFNRDGVVQLNPLLAQRVITREPLFPPLGE